MRSHICLFGHTFERKKSDFELKKATFEGLSVTVPHPAQRFLDEFYGEWQARPVFFQRFYPPKSNSLKEYTPDISTTLLRERLVKNALE